MFFCLGDGHLVWSRGASVIERDTHVCTDLTDLMLRWGNGTGVRYARDIQSG